jgi:hypothetical protein
LSNFETPRISCYDATFMLESKSIGEIDHVYN